MATILWDQSITKQVDWAGDSSTNGQPVSGKYVQEFIKNTLEQKFGFMKYDRDESKYYVFADEYNYNLWNTNKIENADLLLAEFDAPVPASIESVDKFKSADSVTTLLTGSGREIRFSFIVIDKSNNVISDTVNARFTFASANDTKTYTTTISPDTSVYKENEEDDNTTPNWKNKEIGTRYSKNIDEYLTNEGTYTITVVLTGINSKATTTFTFFYTVVNLDLTVNFDYTSTLDMDQAVYQDEFSVYYEGANNIAKTLELYIDGACIFQDTIGVKMSDTKVIPLTNKVDGVQVVWGDKDKAGLDVPTDLIGKAIFTEGKHNLQARISIPGERTGENFWSMTKYCDFIVENKVSGEDKAYLLYKAEGDAGTLIDADKPIEINTKQYNFINIDVIGIRLNGGQIPIQYNITGVNTDFSQVLSHTVDNKETDHFINSFDNEDIYNIAIKDGINNETQLNVKVTVEAYELGGEVVEEQLIDNLLVKYKAINRSNTEDERNVWVNSAPNFAAANPYPVEFNDKVLWNDKSGWDGKALVLSNGATATFNIDLFSLFNKDTGGLTFEIDFETFNVLDDDAILMDYSDPADINKSFIKITATSGEMQSNGESYLKTNFNSNVRNKIAFCFDRTRTVVNGVSNDKGNPNLIMIYVNGVLDRANRWGNGQQDSDDVKWLNPTVHNFTIGDPTGKAGIKIYNIRILRQAYEPENAFMNYVVDQGENIPTIMEKNHVLEGDTISLDLVKRQIPTMILSSDYTMLNGPGDKGENTQFDMQYFDPEHPEMNFYLRNGWMSRQGTSSMNYPTKNLRPYFNKNTITTSGKKISHQFNIDNFVGINYNTEFWPVSEYGTDNENVVDTYVDEYGIPPYAVNKKQITKHSPALKKGGFDNSYHEVAYLLSNDFKKKLAKKYAENHIELFAKGDSGFYLLKEEEDNKISDQIDTIVNNGGSVYISAYRPLRRSGWELDSDEYWSYLRQLRYSGVTIYERSDVLDENGALINSNYAKAKKLKQGKEYYGLGAYWRQWNTEGRLSGWTDRWTIKADYAESSMSHNGGVGALWGNALKNTTINGKYPCRTMAQGWNPVAEDEYASVKGNTDWIDIRTSCDSKPIVIFVKNPDHIDAETGKIVYKTPEFVGLFNIMTDKSSVELFGFRDIKDENNNYIFIADASAESDKAKIPEGQETNKVQCWEFLQNGSNIGKGITTAFSSHDETTYEKSKMLVDKESGDEMGRDIGDGRPIYVDFEPRWPESGEERHEGDMMWAQDEVFGTESNFFENFWLWLHFTQPAINYIVDGTMDGYTLNPYVKFESMDAAVAYKEANPDKSIYVRFEDSGNIKYAAEGEEWKDNGVTKTFEFDPNTLGQELYYLNESINYENVTKTINTKTIRQQWPNQSDIYKVSVPGFDAKNRFFNEDGTIDDDAAMPYYIDVYMWREGNRYKFYNTYGEEEVYDKSGEISADDDYMKDSTGRSYADKTFMQFFSETKYDHLDVYKVAAYFVYIMRFGAVDQCVKNCMMTSEDGKHWYFINYDNDTILGVRNDAVLKYNWDFDRDTYDASINAYAYAGAQSVLWNNLTQDEDFMSIVKIVDGALYAYNLSAKMVLQYLDEKMVGTWNERLYNAQEQIKYLTTFKNDFNTVKYLAFVQGTRKSHRNWWVTKRWELFDAEWGTGEWSQNRLQVYMGINGSPTNPVDFLRIVAASKYTFDLQTNNRSIFGKPLTLGMEEARTLVATWTQNLTSDPTIIIGPHKIKVLNFRPNCDNIANAFSMAMLYDKYNKDLGDYVKTNWIRENGALMTKFLLGNGTHECEVSSIDGINDVYSLEEIDIRKCVNLPGSFVINSLTNLHRFRAGGSSIRTFEPAKGALLYEVQLPSERQYYLQTLTLDGTIFAQQLPSENTVYQTDEFGDKLPYDIDEEGNLTGIYTNEKAYRYTQDSKAIFDVEPTDRLTSVTFNGVQGLDTLLFIKDLKDKIIAAGKSVSQTRLNLVNIEWDNITVNELIDLRFGANTFEFASFTGLINVISDEFEEDGVTHKASITEEEYNKLIDAFKDNGGGDTGTKIFDSNNPIRITSGDAVYFQPTPDTRQIALESYSEDGDTSSFVTLTTPNSVNANGAKMYKLIRGDKFKAKATVFTSVGKEYVYTLSTIRNAVATATIVINDNEVHDEFKSTFGISVKRTAGGDLELTSFEKTNTAFYTNTVLAIGIYELVNGNANGNIYTASNNIYCGIIDKIVPKTNEITLTIDSADVRTAYEIVDENEHTIEFNLGLSTNAELKKLTPTFAKPENAEFINFQDYVYDYNTNKVTMKFTGTIPENSIDDNNITFNFVFDSQSNANVNKVINFKFVSIYASEEATTILLDGTALSDEKVKVDKPGIYTFKVVLGPDDYNVAIDEITVNHTPTMGNNYFINNFEKSSINENNEFTITIKNNNFESFGLRADVTINFKDKYNKHPFSKTFVFESVIIYPTIDKVYLGVQNYNEIGAPDIKGDRRENDNLLSNEIFVLAGCSTTGSDESKKLIPGKSYIEVKLGVDKQTFINGTEQDVYDPTVDYILEFTGTINKEKANIAQQVQETQVTMELVSDGHNHGNNVLRLYIDEQTPTYIGTIIISGKYKLKYDVDEDPDNANDIESTYDFILRINYTIASASTYKKLEMNEIYLVDTDSNFYKMTFDETTKQLTTDSAYIINQAINADIKFAGYGYITGTGVERNCYFIALFDNSSRMFTDNDATIESSPLQKFYPRGKAIGNMYEAPDTDEESKAFKGFNDTNIWKDGVNEDGLVNSAEYDLSGFAKLYDYYSDNENATVVTTKVHTYIPIINEVLAVLRNLVDIDKFINLVNSVNAQYASKNIDIVYMTINDYIRPISTKSSYLTFGINSSVLNTYTGEILLICSNFVSGTTTNNYQTYEGIFIPSTGSVTKGSAASGATMGNVFNISTSMSSNVEAWTVFRKYISILPFIKVS